MVVISHSARLGWPEIESVLKPWGLGNIAVMVFFCLSGYIIAEALDLFYRQRIGKFLLNRALRIIPPYLAALLLSIFVHLWLASLGQMVFFDYDSVPEGIFSGNNLLSNFLLIISLYGLGHVGLEPDYPFVRYVWAVRVEIHFYVVYALLCWTLTAGRFLGLLRNYLMPLAFVLFSALFFLSIWTKASFLNYFSFGPYFMLGVSLYLAIEKLNRLAKLAACLSLAMCVTHYVIYVGKGTNSFVWGPVALLLVFFAVVVILARTRRGESLKQLDQWLGDLSYPMYLNHYAVTVIMLSLFPVGSVSLFLLCIFLCLGASWAVAQLTEPFTKGLRNRIRGVALR
jgi:peptidoglycan/LPS O-acetylase OafA/YrhL